MLSEIKSIGIIFDEKFHFIPPREFLCVALSNVLKVGSLSQSCWPKPRFCVPLHSGADFVPMDKGVRPHFVQLPLHYIKLTRENHSSDDADQYESASKQTNMARPSSQHPLIRLVLGLGATTAAVFVAFKSAEYADDRGSRFWWLPFLSFLALAFWIAAHAIPIGLLD